jgi:hypothetical protein
MEKTNIAFALITTILGLYIAVALLLSRVQGSNRRAHGAPDHGRRERFPPMNP